MRLANLKTTLARLGRAWPIAACIAFALLIQTPASADQPPLGLKFGVQPWTPVTDDDAVHFLVDSPTFLSDGMNLAWNLFSDELRQKIVDKLQTPDMLMKGVTLYDVDVRLNQPTFSFANLKGGSQPGEPFYADLSVTLNDEGVTLTSTTPDFIPDIDLTKITNLLLTPFGRTFSEVKIVPDAHGIGSFGDPRCSADFDATVHLKVKFENIPGAALSSDQLDASSPPVIDFTRFHFDSNNAVCDIPVGLASLLDLKPFIEALVTNPPANGGLVEGPLNDAVRKAIAGFIKDANATLAPLQNKYPEINLLLAQAWIVPEPGGQQIVLDLSPSPRLPDPTAGLGRLSGTITAATPVGLQSQAGTVHCEQLPVTVARKWGPRKMVGPSGTLGDEDYEALSVKPGCSEGQLEPGQTGHYTITGLSALFPQTIIFGTAGAGCNGPEAGVKQGIDVRAAGWTEGKMRPQDLYLQGIDLNNIVSAVKTQQPASLFSQHDIAARHWLLTCGNVQHPFDLSKFLWQINPGDIASNPTTNVANPAVNTAAPLVLASPLSSAAAALAAAQGGAPAISGKLAGNLANVKNLAAQNLAINPAGVAPIVPQTQRVMTQNLPLPANCKDTSEGRVCSQSQAIISGVPVTPADQQARGLVTVGGGCSGTLINQYWVLTAHHCIAVGGRLPPGALQPPGNIAITATWSGKTPVATKFVDYGVGANPIDMALIFLGNGDFGPAPIQPLAVGDIDNGDTLEKFGQGYSTYAIAGPPPIPAQGLGTYTTGTFTSSGVTHYGYVLANPPDPATLSAPQSGEGGDSGGPDWLVGPGGVLGGIVGVQSTCQPTGQVTPLPNNWLWVTGISGCYSPSIASVRDNIISASQEKPQLRQALKKGVDKFTVRAADIYLTAWHVDNLDQSHWALAARAANDICFYRGYIGGHWSGEQDAPAGQYSIVCEGTDAATWFDVTRPELAATGQDLSDGQAQFLVSIDRVPWAQALRAGSRLCGSKGFAGGYLNGEWDPSKNVYGLVCVNKASGQWFDATDAEISATGSNFADVNADQSAQMASGAPGGWANAFRAASAICVSKGFVGGVLTGEQVPGKRGVVCEKPSLGILTTLEGGLAGGNGGPVGVPSIPTTPKPAAGVNVTGEWLLRLANGNMNTIFLQQNAAGNVGGQIGSLKIYSGVVVGHEIFGRWLDGDAGGTLHFILAPDNFTFAGMRTASEVPPEPKNSASSWDGYRTNQFPATANNPDFGGTWTVTQSDGPSYTMALTQNGGALGGIYDPTSRKGTIRGKVGIEGMIIKHAVFDWSQAGNGLSGSGWLNSYPDGSGFSGGWRMADNTAGAWSARRLVVAPRPGTGSTTLPGKLGGVPLPMAPPPVPPPQPNPAGLVALSVTCAGFVRGTQEECGQTADLPFTANGATSWAATLKAPDAHCSSIIYYVTSPLSAIKTDAQYSLTHGYPGTQALAAGQSVQVAFTAAFPTGDQHLTIHAIGVPGGCNSGTLANWGVEASIAATGAPAATSKLKFHTKGIIGKGTPPIEQPR